MNPILPAVLVICIARSKNSTYRSQCRSAVLYCEWLLMKSLTDGIDALLVSPGDGWAVAEAVARVLADPFLAQRLGMGALQLAAHFDWRSIAERHVALYGEL